MRYHRPVIALFSGAVAASAVVIGGATVAGAASHTDAMPAAKPSAHAQTTSATTLRTETATVMGTREKILVNAKGLPLYYYSLDTAKKSAVTGALAKNWPPLTSTANKVSGPTGKITVVRSTNGRQVEFNGHFLYTFIADSPGHVTGQGVHNFFVATPRLKASTVSATVAPSAPSALSAPATPAAPAAPAAPSVPASTVAPSAPATTMAPAAPAATASGGGIGF